MGVPGLNLWLNTAHKYNFKNIFYFIDYNFDLIFSIIDFELESEDFFNKILIIFNDNIDKYKLENFTNEFLSKKKKFSNDYLFIDVNSIIYDSYNHLLKKIDYDISEENIIKLLTINTILFILLLIYFYNPNNFIFISFDGIASLSKINQQFMRRSKYIIDNEYIKKNKHFNWSTLNITVGTKFMDDLCNNVILFFKNYKNNKNTFEFVKNYSYDKSLLKNNYLDNDVNQYYTLNKNVIISSHLVNGEGEQKIINFIKNNISSQKKQNIFIFSPDADLIFLTLTINHNFYIINNKLLIKIMKNYKIIKNHLNFKNFIKEKINECTDDIGPEIMGLISIKKVKKFIEFILIQRIQEYMLYIPSNNAINQNKNNLLYFLNFLFNKNIDNLVINNIDKNNLFIDFIFLCSFAGNDFIPGLLSINFSNCNFFFKKNDINLTDNNLHINNKFGAMKIDILLYCYSYLKNLNNNYLISYDHILSLYVINKKFLQDLVEIFYKLKIENICLENYLINSDLKKFVTKKENCLNKNYFDIKLNSDKICDDLIQNTNNISDETIISILLDKKYIYNQNKLCEIYKNNFDKLFIDNDIKIIYNDFYNDNLITIKNITHEYVDMLLWIINFYLGKNVDFTKYYKYNKVPFFNDIGKYIGDININVINMENINNFTNNIFISDHLLLLFINNKDHVKYYNLNDDLYKKIIDLKKKPMLDIFLKLKIYKANTIIYLDLYYFFYRCILYDNDYEKKIEKNYNYNVINKYYDYINFNINENITCFLI